MEDVININEYIRTNSGTIAKLKRIEFDKVDKDLKWYFYDKKEPDINIVKEWCINKPYIVKHSPNIIDLIEEGDFVNGYICKRIPNFDNKMCNFDLNLMQWIPLEDIDVWYNIVTKEQFNQMKYIVGDE